MALMLDSGLALGIELRRRRSCIKSSRLVIFKCWSNLEVIFFRIGLFKSAFYVASSWTLDLSMNSRMASCGVNCIYSKITFFKSSPNLYVILVWEYAKNKLRADLSILNSDSESECYQIWDRIKSSSSRFHWVGALHYE